MLSKSQWCHSMFFIIYTNCRITTDTNAPIVDDFFYSVVTWNDICWSIPNRNLIDVQCVTKVKMGLNFCGVKQNCKDDYTLPFISSPEPKAQAKFSELKNLSILLHRCHQLFTFSTSSDQTCHKAALVIGNLCWSKMNLAHLSYKLKGPFLITCYLCVCL